MMKKRFALYILSSVILTSSLFSACGKTVEESPVVVVESSDETISYKMATVLRGDVQRTKKIKITYKQTDAEEIVIPVSGKYISKVHAKEGEAVKKGDLLIELSADSLEEQIAELEYNIKRNELLLSYLDVNEDYDISEMWLYGYGNDAIAASVSRLKKNNKYKREDYNDALEFDRQLLAKLRAEFKNSKIYANKDGNIYKLKENLEGSTSSKDVVVMTIVDSSECLFISEDAELTKDIKDGEVFTMTISTGNSPGEYELVPYDRENWNEVQSFAIISGPDGYSLDVGAYGNIKIILEEKKNCLYLPSTVVHTADDESYVYILDENNMRTVRFVETGLYGDDTVEITGGLEEGDKVVKR